MADCSEESYLDCDINNLGIEQLLKLLITQTDSGCPAFRLKLAPGQEALLETGWIQITPAQMVQIGDTVITTIDTPADKIPQVESALWAFEAGTTPYAATMGALPTIKMNGATQTLIDIPINGLNANAYGQAAVQNSGFGNTLVGGKVVFTTQGGAGNNPSGGGDGTLYLNIHYTLIDKPF